MDVLPVSEKMIVDSIHSVLFVTGQGDSARRIRL